MSLVSIWDEMTPEERAVMTTAIEEGYLNGVIGDFLGHAEHGGAVWISGSDIGTIRVLVPQFAAIVRDMIARGLIEVCEPLTAPGTAHHPSPRLRSTPCSPTRGPGCGPTTGTTAW